MVLHLLVIVVSLLVADAHTSALAARNYANPLHGVLIARQFDIPVPSGIPEQCQLTCAPTVDVYDSCDSGNTTCVCTNSNGQSPQSYMDCFVSNTGDIRMRRLRFVFVTWSFTSAYSNLLQTLMDV